MRTQQCLPGSSLSSIPYRSILLLCVMCILNPVPFYTQGFFIFFFHVIRNKNVSRGLLSFLSMKYVNYQNITGVNEATKGIFYILFGHFQKRV